MEKSLVIAACLHPYFKLSWLEGDNKSLAEVWLKSIFECLSRQSDLEIEVESNDDDNFENNFFCLPTNHLANSISTDQLQLYLNSNDKELQSLINWPMVREKFIQYNCGMPSSAPVERLFSTGGNTMTVKRHRLSDTTFENLVLLKQNNKIMT